MQVQPFRSSGPETKKINFFIFFMIMGKVYMRQYDHQKAQIEHKAQICAEFHKWLYNCFRTVVRKRKYDARPAGPAVTCLPFNI